MAGFLKRQTLRSQSQSYVDRYYNAKEQKRLLHIEQNKVKRGQRFLTEVEKIRRDLGIQSPYTTVPY